MAKPILLSVDDDSDVLRAIERDLRAQYGAEYRVIGSDSPTGALELLKQLKVRNDGVALLLADQRMPNLDGVGFLREARQIYPEAKRALLTAYADTNAAISAINQANIDYFFMKPWDPPAEHLYPQLNDLLDDWQASYRPAFEGIRVLGTRWSPRSYDLRDFLARNHVPYQWIDVELSANDPETKRLLEALGPEASSLPVVLFSDGTKLLESVPADVAQKVGLRTRAQTDFYDLAIIGGGPAGLAAAVYGASEGLHTVMIERQAPGGQAGMSSRIENYLGFPAGLSGADLARRAMVQAQRFGVEILSQEAVGVRTEGPYRIIKFADNNEISCHALMIATGVQWRRLEAPGIDRIRTKHRNFFEMRLAVRLGHAGMSPQLNVGHLFNLVDQVRRHGTGERFPAHQDHDPLRVLGKIHGGLPG
jgi:thioredoxin reductase (NADPH)